MQAHPGDAAVQQLGQLVINSVASERSVHDGASVGSLLTTIVRSRTVAWTCAPATGCTGRSALQLLGVALLCSPSYTLFHLEV
eukprot:scaffold4170_cov63-Phaeocystis_antarctica.AAC.16